MLALVLRVLNALLNVPYGVHVFVQFGAVSPAQRPRQRLNILRDGIENSSGLLHARPALRRAAAISEQPFEYDSRMCLGRIRSRFVAPRDGVYIETIAGIARALRGKVDGDFKR